MEIMKALNLATDGVSKEMNDSVWEHFESMNRILENLIPLNIELKHPLQNP